MLLSLLDSDQLLHYLFPTLILSLIKVLHQKVKKWYEDMKCHYHWSKLSLDNFLECALTEMTILTMYWKENPLYSRRLNCLEKSWLIAAEMWSSKMITVLMSSSLLLTLEIFNCSLGLNCKIMPLLLEKQNWNMPYK